MTKNQNMEN